MNWTAAWTAKRRLVRMSLPSLERAARHLPNMLPAYECKLELLHRVQARLNRARANAQRERAA